MDGKLDLLLTGGRVLDPATGRDEIADIGVKDGAIAAIDRHIPVDAAGAVEDVSGQLVVAGLIDTHGHVYQHVTGKFGLPPDQVGVASGVTTVVDQGGPSCMTIPGFRNFIVDRAETRILCFISAYLVGGLEGHLYPALYGPDQVDVAHTVRAARENADIVRGGEGACRNRRRVALGPRRDQARQAHRAGGRTAAVHPSGPALADRGQAGARTRTRWSRNSCR